MKKLADISAFEGLQGQANRDMGIGQSFSIFNAKQRIELNKGDLRYLEGLEKEWFDELEKHRAQGLSNEELEEKMTPMWESLKQKAENYGVEIAYHLTRRYGDKWADGKNVRDDLLHSIAEIHGNKCTKIFHFLCTTMITDAIYAGPTGEDDLEAMDEED